MKRNYLFVLIVAFLTLLSAKGQERYKTSVGEVSFDASSPLEDIKATNDQVNAILDVTSGEMAAVLLIKDFEFRRKLMQEHFNENYMHSDEFPKAVFTGNLSDFDFAAINTQDQEFQLSGEITIHGVTKPLKTAVQLRQSANGISCRLNFVVQTEEHDIKVPRVVFKKVAQEVNVNAAFLLHPQ